MKSVRNIGFTFAPEKIISFIDQNNGITATQFHPEKSTSWFRFF